MSAFRNILRQKGYAIPARSPRPRSKSVLAGAEPRENLRQSSGAAGLAQGRPVGFRLQQLGEGTEKLQMRVRGAFRHQQNGQKIHRRPIHALEVDGCLEAKEPHGGLGKRCEAAVGKGKALAEARGPQALPGQQAVENRVRGGAPPQRIRLLGADHFKRPLSAGSTNIHRHELGAQTVR